jgi:acyl-CoA reductase-like NAD-dependent aldehyde dehydrogenase
MSIPAEQQSALRDLIQDQREFFGSGRTRDITFRITQLRTLRTAIIDSEAAILEACRSDMNKPPLEAYTSERGMVLNEIDHALRNLDSWAKPMRVKTPMLHTRLFGLAHHFLASSHVYSEPYGIVLIIGPWNCPFQLMLSPLVGAIAAGNCAVLKPSEIAPASSRVIRTLIRDHFDPKFVSVVEGDSATASALLSEKFDYIFFTGGVRVGKLVMEAAARQLTPVTLELGGKNPCIVDHDIHVEHAARRIVWGKFFNAGQTCMTTDYLLVDRAIKKELLAGIEATIREFYGDDPSTSPDYARIVSDRHFARLARLLEEGEVVIGGGSNAATRYIAPTVIDSVLPEHDLMKEEIFGPILPVLAYDRLDDAIAFVTARPKPLALFFFSRNREKQERILRETSSGGGCINETFVHEISRCLPFGGVGTSGTGKYHGKFSFDTFSNKKSIVKKTFLFDLRLRCPPYREKLGRLKRFL